MSQKPRKREKRLQSDSQIITDIYDGISANIHLTYDLKPLFEFNEVHTNFLHLLQTNKTKMAIVDGPAGSAKTYLAIYAGLHLLKERYIDQIYYVRSIVESASKQIGSLPGEVNDKFLPWSMPLLEKLNEIIGKTQTEALYKAGLVKGIPVNFCRGLTFNRTLVVVDEFQNLTFNEAMVVMTRFGTKSKYVLIGDSRQTDIGHNTCFHKVFNCFDNEQSRQNEIHCLKFTENEIVRSEILKFIVQQLEVARLNPK